jgi:hypothetical protein
VQIYDRHIRSWVPSINFTSIAVRAQLYILWKSAWQENTNPPTQVDRAMILDAATMTRLEVSKDHNKWERNYSAARRRDWDPNFPTFYDEVFKGTWAHGLWHPPGQLPQPPRFLAQMARKVAKNVPDVATMETAQHSPLEESMSPVAIRTLKLRIIELEGINQGLREELGRPVRG